MQRLRRFSRFWDLVANSGNFISTAPLIWWEDRSPFWAFLEWTDWAFARAGRQHAIALPRLAELLFQYLTAHRSLDAQRVAQSIAHDYHRGNRPDVPDFLRPFVPVPDRTARERIVTRALPRRQARHVSE